MSVVETIRIQRMLLLAAIVSAAGIGVRPPLARGGEWVLSVGSRPEKRRMQTWEQHYDAIPLSGALDRLGTNLWRFVDSWKLSGPFTQRQANVILGSWWDGTKDFNYVDWQAERPYQLNVVVPAAGSNGVFLVLGEVTSRVEQDVWLAVGVDAALTLWICGDDERRPIRQKLLPPVDGGGWWPMTGVIRIRLRKGTSRLLFIAEPDGGCRVSAMLKGFHM